MDSQIHMMKKLIAHHNLTHEEYKKVVEILVSRMPC